VPTTYEDTLNLGLITNEYDLTVFLSLGYGAKDKTVFEEIQKLGWCDGT
jgi:hypothetical protein